MVIIIIPFPQRKVIDTDRRELESVPRYPAFRTAYDNNVF